MRSNLKVMTAKMFKKDAEDMKIKNFKPVTSVTTDDGKTVDRLSVEAKALKLMFEMQTGSQKGGEENQRKVLKMQYKKKKA